MRSLCVCREKGRQLRPSNPIFEALYLRYRDIHGRHKELLTELFYFTKHPEIPPDSESIQENAAAESTDLNDFLHANDLDRSVSLRLFT